MRIYINVQKNKICCCKFTNSRIGTLLDFIEYDVMGTEMNNFLSLVIDYNCDVPMPVRQSHDTTVNSFGRKLLQLYRSTCTRVCNGRTVCEKKGRYKFLNHIGASVNVAIVIENYFHVIISMLTILMNGLTMLLYIFIYV